MERFIEAVRQYPCIWNINDKDYRHGDKKETAWNEIVGLNIPEIKDTKTAKSEWKKFRDNHRDSLKRQKSGKTGQAASSVNTWKYAQIMEFLIPYMKNRERSTNLTNSQPTQNTNTEQSTQDSGNEPSGHHTTQVSSYEEQSTTSIVADNASEEVESTPQTQPTRKRKNDDIIDIIREIENNHIRRQEDRDIRRKETKHPIETFFQSMGQTTKSTYANVSAKYNQKKGFRNCM
ncbi:uncharacterized protein LOC120636398 [Pararge aegeria]|uniref:uncharacterized protein LOC120636398 n=1 Tax=Pararge aegeria TaxID=116150 RepID=UPI0019D26657|nr:uncharacterized protein LOC120636398 [Pararge aegeria]